MPVWCCYPKPALCTSWIASDCCLSPRNVGLAGAMFANLIGANVAVFAIVGSVAVLAGAANTPLACTFIGIELFGGNGAILFALACVAAYATSGHTGIYHAQKVVAHKSGEAIT